jgi:1,4-alpha-glucan branching enzyme
MKTKTADKNMKETNSKPVEFSCHAPKAKAVFVAGTFNDWKPDAEPLHHHPPNGKWTVMLSLPPGHHEFKFVVDGQWCCEPGCEREHQGCPKCVPNQFGTMNRVLEVR